MSQIQQWKEGNFTNVSKKMQDLGLSKELVKKELSFAMQIINSNAYLLRCTPNSIMASVLNVANMGLTLNPSAKEAYLIPRYNSTVRGFECTLTPSYIGLKNLIIKSGGVTKILANIAHKNDAFAIDLADDVKPVSHAPYLQGDRGEVIGAYGIATMSDGTKQVEWVDIESLHNVRSRSDSYVKSIEKKARGEKGKPSTWETDFGEMARKTVIRRMYKYLPEGDKKEQVAAAIEADNRDYSAQFWQISKIEMLLRTANIDAEQAQKIERSMSEFSFYRAKECIAWLEENQIPNTPEYNGGSGNMTSLKGAVAEKVAMENT